MSDQIQNILQRGKLDDASEFSRQEMLALFHKPDMEFLVKEQLFEEMETIEVNETFSREMQKVFSRLWMKIEKNKPKQKSVAHILYAVSKIAAVLVVGLLCGIYISSLKTGQKKSEYYAAHSPMGSISEMILPDGSVIFLNADSHIKYSMQGEKGIREVFLEGEAWFDVTKNVKKPFIVHTRNYNVMVTGTRFNIKAYNSEKEITTTLEEGTVVIQSDENSRLANDITLKPGEQLVFDTEASSAKIKTVNTKWFTSWKDNKLIFINMELKDLVVLLERKYGVDIDVNKRELMELHFDGTIKNESIIEILEILKKTLPIDYKITGQRIEITNNIN